MQIHVEYDDARECIVAVISGKTEESLFNDYSKEVLKCHKLHPECTKLISDFRESELDPSVVDFYNQPKKLLKIGMFIKKMKRALIVKTITKDLLFYETTSFNQGHRVKVFDDIEKARKWMST